jgi:hypothetical protein
LEIRAPHVACRRSHVSGCSLKSVVWSLISNGYAFLCFHEKKTPIGTCWDDSSQIRDSGWAGCRKEFWREMNHSNNWTTSHLFNPVRPARGWWLLLICSKRKVPLIGWWRVLICSERKVLLTNDWYPNEQNNFLHILVTIL